MVMVYYLSVLYYVVKVNQCDVVVIVIYFLCLQFIVLDILVVFKGVEKLFLEVLDKLQGVVGSVVIVVLMSCVVFVIVLQFVDDVCDSCYKWFC